MSSGAMPSASSVPPTSDSPCPTLPLRPAATFCQIPWIVPGKGPVGSAAPNPNNGHCVPAVAYDQRFIYVVTWGAIKTMSRRFYDAYADEAFAVLSPDWINKKVGTSPSGFDMAALTQDLTAVSQAQNAAAGPIKSFAQGSALLRRAGLFIRRHLSL